MATGSRPKKPSTAIAIVRRRTLLGVAFAGLPTPLPGVSNEACDTETDDAVLLALCAQAHALDASDAPEAGTEWERVISALSALPAHTAAGVRAKADLLRSLVTASSDRKSARRLSPDEQLLASLLDDLLGCPTPALRRHA